MAGATDGWEQGSVGGAALVELLAGFARTLLEDYRVQDILDRLTARTPAVLPVDGAGVMLEDAEGVLRFAAASDMAVRHIETLQIELGEGPCVHAYTTGEQVLLNDLADCPRFPAFAPRARAVGLGAVYSFPMWQQHHGFGALNLYRAAPAVLTPGQVAAGQTLADVATVYLVNARNRQRSQEAEAELRISAVTDPLTGLANRRLFVDHLELALARGRRSGHRVAVLYLDVDRFKQVNDRFGHAAGDQVLTELAARLRRAVRPTDTAARLGGDEFAVLCEDLTEDTSAHTVAHRIFTITADPVTFEGQAIPVSVSIGVTLTDAADSTAQSVLAQADAAMYRAKDNGRGRIKFD